MCADYVQQGNGLDLFDGFFFGPGGTGGTGM
jgi:hypothetical protein